MGNAIADNTTTTTTETKKTVQTTNKADKSKHPFKDSEITAKVKEKLFEKKDVPSMRVHVKTVNGVVYLRGKVSSKEQEDNAISVAKSIEGVKDVKSKLVIKEKKVKK